MLLNTAPYLFKGYSLKEEISTDNSKEAKGSVSVGLKFLQNLISPLSIDGEASLKSSSSSTAERLYTLGGLHMSLIDELRKKNQLKNLNISKKEEDIKKSAFVGVNAILKPVDFYEIIEILSLIRPLIAKYFEEFKPTSEDTIDENGTLIVNSDNQWVENVPQLDSMIEALLKSLKEDYLRSKQLEMVMISPTTGKQIGVVDIDLGESDPLEIKAKLSDSQFYIVGKVVRYVSKESSLSLVQRTVLSQVISLTEKLVKLSDEEQTLQGYSSMIDTSKKMVEKVLQLDLPGPAVRVLALSINA